MNAADYPLNIIPRPRRINVAGKAVLMPTCGRIVQRLLSDDPSMTFVHQLLDEIKQATGFTWDYAIGEHWSSWIELSTDDSLEQHGSYRLGIDAQGVRVVGADREGVRNGVQTLRQIIRQRGGVLPCAQISDEPVFAHRGYYLDVTRGRVPTLKTLKSWADQLCLYKYNELQLYIEHTFKFDGLSQTWRGVCPLTCSDIVEFDQYCADLGLELIPSLSSFGHHYMMLRTSTKRHLSEFPDESDRPYSFIERQMHHTLNATTDESFDLIAGMITQYADLFRSKRFNICADETFDLGKGATKTTAKRVGIHRLYADFVHRLCDHVRALGREVMMWGDIALGWPEILEELPEDLTLLNWQYDPFVSDDSVRLLAQHSVRQYVCPAVACWNGVLPKVKRAWNNIVRMCDYGSQYGADGVLVTDWGDYGHVNDLQLSRVAMIYGAAYSWQPYEASTGSHGACVDHGHASAYRDEAFAGLNAAIARLAYGDRTGRVVDYLAQAELCVEFGWDFWVRYLELDAGGGNLNTQVFELLDIPQLRALSQRSAGVEQCGDAREPVDSAGLINSDPSADSGKPCDGAEASERSSLSQVESQASSQNVPHTLSLSAVRHMIWRASEKQLRRILDANAQLVSVKLTIMQCLIASPSATSQRLLCLCLDGQMIFNALAVHLSSKYASSVNTTIASDDSLAQSSHQGGADSQAASSNYLMMSDEQLAQSLESWAEAYADVWRQSCRESELHRVLHVLWQLADLLHQ